MSVQPNLKQPRFTDFSRPIYRPHDRPTGRGWLFLGENGGPCDKACKFCYYAYQPDLVFFDLNTILMIANRFRWVYGLDSCDISGGEPTIYPKLAQVVEHCANIGLRPTLISHGQNCSEKKVREVEEAGLDDWLISLHGMGDAHDSAVVDRKGNGEGGFKRLLAGLSHMERPVRFNTTLQSHNFKILPEMAQWLADNREPTAWNMIQFNPFGAWDGMDTIDFQVKMAELAPFVGKAVEIAESAGFEVNVRYFPFCVASEFGFDKNCINYYQTQYDPWEWGLEATQRMKQLDIHELGGAEKVRRMICDEIRESRMNPVCAPCKFSKICEGPTSQYQRRYGLDELKPASGAPVDEVTWFEHKGNTWPKAG